jgi:hypothetical protein
MKITFCYTAMLPALAGCSTQQLWYKQDGTLRVFAQARYECMKQSHQPKSGADVNAAQGAASSGPVPNDQPFVACMNAYGWYLTRAL